MSPLFSCQSLSKSHGSRLLFSNVSLGVYQGDKIGLIGPNGSGKSTLLKIFAGIEKADDGDLAYKKGLTLGYVAQDASFPDEPIEQIIIDAFPDHSSMDFHEKQVQAQILLTKFGFTDLSQKASVLSGGWKKRLDIAKTLVSKPDVILLDEPTNHLDLDGILWLEKFLKKENFAFIVTSHDRYFLENIATKMIELNPLFPEGILLSKGGYISFLQKKEDYLNSQDQYQRSLTTKVRSETDWLRQNPKARTTKANARIQEADRLIKELAEMKSRQKQASVKIDFSSTERETKKLIAIKNIGKTLGNRLLFHHLSLTVVPGMRLGIVGTNGSGKSTLLKTIAQELLPDQGTIKYADGLRVVYFDQHRQQLPSDVTLRRALASESDSVTYRGQNIHVNSWGKRFGFSPERLDLPIKQLSGGEKARILIARLMLQPADILLLDEPTNDLDIQTLETLEESLMDFPGAIIFITHDRAMLDRVSTGVIGLGILPEPPILADLNQWEAFLSQQKSSDLPEKQSEKTPAKSSSSSKKLSFNEKRELEQMEGKILLLEQQIEILQKEIQTLTEAQKLIPLQEACQKLNTAQQELDKLFFRWQELDEKNS